MKAKLLHNNKRILCLLFHLVIIIIISSAFRSHQSGNYNSVTRSANWVLYDSLFVANDADGWQLYTSYFTTENDSVTIELILGRQVPAGNDWKLPTLAGTIAPQFASTIEQSVNFQEPNRNWDMILKTDGKCFFKLIEGEPPVGSTIVLPLKTKYKR